MALSMRVSPPCNPLPGRERSQNSSLTMRFELLYSQDIKWKSMGSGCLSRIQGIPQMQYSIAMGL